MDKKEQKEPTEEVESDPASTNEIASGAGATTSSRLVGAVETRIRNLETFYPKIREYNFPLPVLNVFSRIAQSGARIDLDFYKDVKWREDGLPLIPMFDINKIRPDGTVILFGKRRTGKSMMTEHLMYYLAQWVERGIIISEQEQNNGFYSRFFPKFYVKNEINEQVIQEFIDFQAEITKKVREDPMWNQKHRENEFFRYSLIVFDDVISGDFARYSSALNRLFVNGRHIKAPTIFNTQYIRAIGPKIRENADYGILFNSDAENTRKGLSELFGSKVPRFLFETMFDAYTKDHMALVCNVSDSADAVFNERFMWLKAPCETIFDETMGEDIDTSHGNWSFGSKEFWLGAAEGEIRLKGHGDKDAMAQFESEIKEPDF